MMLSLGKFRFSVQTASFQSTEHQTNYRYGTQEAIGKPPIFQFVGKGEETLSLSGVVYPSYQGGLSQVEAMRKEAEKGTPLFLFDPKGNLKGKWIILSVGETNSTFFKDGTPQKIEFSLSLKRAV